MTPGRRGTVLPDVFRRPRDVPTVEWPSPETRFTATVALAARLFARLVPGQGVTLPALVPAVVAALAARAFFQLVGGPLSGPAPVAYIGGTMGTPIGANLLNLPAVLRGKLIESGEDGVVVMSIGAAGVFDGIFLTGILAPLLASP